MNIDDQINLVVEQFRKDSKQLSIQAINEILKNLRTKYGFNHIAIVNEFDGSEYTENQVTFGVDHPMWCKLQFSVLINQNITDKYGRDLSDDEAEEVYIPIEMVASHSFGFDYCLIALYNKNTNEFDIQIHQ